MTTIQVRRGTAAQWVSAATVLAAGELGLDTTNNILKLGDGSTAWASLNPVLNNTYGQLSVDRIHNSGQTASRQIDPTTVTPIATSTAGTLLTVPTGYTGNDIVEPTVLYDAAAPFLGYEYVLCAAPYYTSSDLYENPCLWVSHDGNTWIPVVNGVVTPGYGGTATPIFASNGQGDAHNSDPTLHRGPDGNYYVLWNQFLNPTGSGGTASGSNDWGVKIMKASSLAGTWSTPVLAVQTVKATSKPASPAIFWDGQKWHLYCVDIANTSSTVFLHYTNTSTDPTAGTWTAQANPSISFPVGYSGRVFWHLNAYLVGTQHVIFVQDNTAGSSGGGNLWLATSNDSGATWTISPRPWLVSSTVGYRSALVFTNDGGADVFYGRLGSNWELRRARMSFYGQNSGFAYGGLTPTGLPANALAVVAARVPVSPYQFGDIPSRADSASSPGAADSGQTYTVTAGTVGISSKTLYSPSAGNNKASVTTTVADGVTSWEVAATDGSGQAYACCRITDANNFVRFGFSGITILCQNIVGGSVSQSVTISGNTTIAAGDVLTLVHIGSTVTLYQNGAPIGTGTGWTSGQSATGVGVQINSAGVAKMRNLWQRALVSNA